MSIVTLDTISLSQICHAFTLAFSDYEVPVHVTDEMLQEMIISRDIRLERSFGSIDSGGQLTGVILCAYRTYADGHRMYIATMGVLPDYRSLGIGSALLKKALQCAKHHQVYRVQLEVLEHNIAAQNLYHRAGFSIHRLLRCYRTEAAQLKAITHALSGELVDRQVYQELDHDRYLPYIPSWQYDVPSVLNGYDQSAVLVIKENYSIKGFGTVYRNNGSVAQVGIRDQTQIIPLLAALAHVSPASQIRVMNIASTCAVCTQLDTAGWENFINQYEMYYELHEMPSHSAHMIKPPS